MNIKEDQKWHNKFMPEAYILIKSKRNKTSWNVATYLGKECVASDGQYISASDIKLHYTLVDA